MGTVSSRNNQSVVSQNNASDVDPKNADPRSPTPEIIRTPLQGKNGTKHNITKNMDLRKALETDSGDEKLIHNNPILSAVIKNHLQSYDPRSPTTDFERTPIVVGSKVDDLLNEKNILRQQLNEDYDSPYGKGDNTNVNELNKDLSDNLPEKVAKNLCNDFLDMSLEDTLKETEPLGSSTECQETSINSDKHSPKETKLLETNFDYFEPDNVFLDVPKDVKIIKEDPRSPSHGIERTPIVVMKTDLSPDPSTNVEEMSDDSLIQALQDTNAEFRQTLSKANEIANQGLLIYEDDIPADVNVTPKKAKSASNSGSRTPLSCMKNKADAAHIRSKSANTLLDPKSKKFHSKIPKRVNAAQSLAKPPQNMIRSNLSLKSLANSCPPVSGDCENTPPQTHRDLWDKDLSLVL